MTFPLNINIVLSTQPTYCNSDINGAEVHFPTKFLNRYFTSVFIQVAPDFAGIFSHCFYFHIYVLICSQYTQKTAYKKENSNFFSFKMRVA